MRIILIHSLILAIAGLAMTIVGSVIGYIGIALLVKAIGAEAPLDYIGWGSLFVAMATIGPVLVGLGSKVAWTGFSGAANASSVAGGQAGAPNGFIAGQKTEN